MGKKNKNKGPAVQDEASKRRKISGSSSQFGSSPPPPQPPKSLKNVSYDRMPLNFKKKLYVDDDCGSMKKYIEIISWLRAMACLDGTVFEDIGNLNLSQGYPLVEIEVFTPEQRSSKFIISREDLYLIGFYANNTWMQYNCSYEIENFKLLSDYSGRYTSEPWKCIGPKHMIDAVKMLSSVGLPSTSNYVKACEVFQVHLSEAARFYPIESMICKSLSPLKVGSYNNRTFQDEEKPLLHMDDKSDVYSLVKGDGPIDSNLSVETAVPYTKNIIKNYRKMSKVWYVYALTGKRHFPMETTICRELGIKSKKSLRCTLATLCNINLNKVLVEWKKKSLRQDEVTTEVYNEMEREVHELQRQKKVLVEDEGQV